MRYGVIGILVTIVVFTAVVYKYRRENEQDLRALQATMTRDLRTMQETLARLERVQNRQALRNLAEQPVMRVNPYRPFDFENELTNAAVSTEPIPVEEVTTNTERFENKGSGTERTPVGTSRVDDFAPIYETMEKSFLLEPVDGSWAVDASRLAREIVFEYLPDGSNLWALDCRTSMCRIESEHEGHKGADELTENLLRSADTRPWNGGFASGTISEDDKTGRVVLVTYLMREGYELSRLETGHVTMAVSTP
jgi:hypothetical protein